MNSHSKVFSERWRAADARGGTVAFSWGPWGGFYAKRGAMTRLCLGWVAITYIPQDLDEFLDRLMKLEPTKAEKS